MKRGVLLISSCVILVGCASWRPLPLGDYSNAKHQFSTRIPQDGWMRLGGAKYFVMTRDGLPLEYIAVARSRFDQKLEHTKKRFSGSMSLAEIAEVDLDDIRSRDHVGGFSLKKQEALTVDQQEAYQLHYIYVTKEGLRVKGRHVGFVYKDWVYRIQFEAAAQHYFDAYSADFEAFLKGFKVF